MRAESGNSSARGLVEKAEELWGALAEATTLVWWIRDLASGRIKYVSPGFEALWEMPCDELYQRPAAWLDRIHPDDLARVTARFQAIETTGKAAEVFRLVLPSGKRRWIRDRGILVHREAGLPHVAGLAEDITEARTAQIRLAVQHMVIKILTEGESPSEAFPRLIEAIADPLEWTTAGLWLVDPERDVLRCASFWRQPGGELKAFEDATVDLELERGESLAGRAWASGEPVFEAPLCAGSTSTHRCAAQAVSGGLRSAAAFPIADGQKVIGVLDFAGPDAGIPEAELVRTLTALARQIGLWLERHRLDEEARCETQKLRVVTRSLSAFLATGNWQTASDEMLRGALELTVSPTGFFGVVVGGTVLRVLSWSGLVWDEFVNREFYDAVVRRSEREGYLDFPVGRNLFSLVITEKTTVLANDPAGHPGAGGLPAGHPPLSAFLGVPIHGAGEVIGVLGMGNRPGGYTAAQRDKLEALAVLAGVLCQHYREQLAREKGTERVMDGRAGKGDGPHFAAKRGPSPVP